MTRFEGSVEEAYRAGAHTPDERIRASGQFQNRFFWAQFNRFADGLAAQWQRFQAGLRQHLAMEEQLMFPAFEAVTGMTGGPTQVMRMEHEQMRGLLDQMSAAVARGDSEELLDQGDTLNILIQQHNMKEEGMLYPMAERALQVDWAELRGQLDAFELGT